MKIKIKINVKQSKLSPEMSHVVRQNNKKIEKNKLLTAAAATVYFCTYDPLFQVSMFCCVLWNPGIEQNKN